MISYVTRKNVDEIKYNNCIKNALNSRVYAYSWYLDCVADNWDALILNDYEAVMPLPWRTKYFIKYIYPPAWTQQLGIFSSFNIDAKLTQQFIQSIPKKFKKVTIQFNSGNDLSLFKVKERVNYILPLNKSYEEVFNCYRKDRKHRLLQAENNKLIVSKGSFQDLERIVKLNYSFLNISNEQLNQLFKISKIDNNYFQASILSCYTFNNECIGITIYLKDSKRLTLLFSAKTEKGKKLQAGTFMINHLIRSYTKSNMFLDFEGSMVKGVADFYKSFGSIIESYSLFKKTFTLF
jgi:hypothetical protein